MVMPSRASSFEAWSSVWTEPSPMAYPETDSETCRCQLSIRVQVKECSRSRKASNCKKSERVSGALSVVGRASATSQAHLTRLQNKIPTDEMIHFLRLDQLSGLAASLYGAEPSRENQHPQPRSEPTETQISVQKQNTHCGPSQST